MDVFNVINLVDVKSHYDLRVKTHYRLLQMHNDGLVDDFASLALGEGKGEDDASGNYSAREHSLGSRILQSNRNAAQRVFDLASELLACKSPMEVTILIRRANLISLKVGVGSEISCMMQPSLCWVTNVRTVWAHLVVKYGGNRGKADEALLLYRQSDTESEMAYRMWEAIHDEMGQDMERIFVIGKQLSAAGGVESGDLRFLWADAVANGLYDAYHA